MEFVKQIPRPQFLQPKTVIRDIGLFATKVRKWFEMGSNQYEKLLFFTRYYFNLSFWIKQKMRKLLRKHKNFRVVFWKKYDTTKKNSATASRDGRDKFYVCLE